jgi:hypothetical protein
VPWHLPLPTVAPPKRVPALQAARRVRPSPPQGSRESGGERVLPYELRRADHVTVNGTEWEVAAAPAVYLQGKRLTVRLQKPGDPSVTDAQDGPAHRRVTVRRG